MSKDFKQALRLLQNLGYQVGENGELIDANWEGNHKEIRSILWPEHGLRLGLLTYDQRHAVYDSLIPILREHIATEPEDAAGYALLSEIYCRLNEMELCLEIRKQGFERTGDGNLTPEEYTTVAGNLDQESFAQRRDPWGRLIEQDGETSGYIKIVEEYNDAYELSSWRGETAAGKYVIQSYMYENGRYVSSIVSNYMSDGTLESRTEHKYDYPEEGICIES